MKIHEFQGKLNKRKKRIGRGGKRGTTSGRGQKGQKSRAGRRIRPAVRDLIIRIPKRRGFRNKPKGKKPYTIEVMRLVKKIEPLRGAETLFVDPAVLQKVGLLSLHFAGSVKILGKGTVTFPITLKGIKASESVKSAIIKAGGKII